MRFIQLGLKEAAAWAERLAPLVKQGFSDLNIAGWRVSTPEPIMSVGVGPVETEEDVDKLAEALKRCVRGEDPKWRGDKLKFAAVVMQLGRV